MKIFLGINKFANTIITIPGRYLFFRNVSAPALLLGALYLLNPASVAVAHECPTGAHTTSISDVTLSVSPSTVTEGSAVTVTATLSSGVSCDVNIPLTLTAGTAESGDYGTLAQISISENSTSGTGTISTNQDIDTDDETFTVSINTSQLNNYETRYSYGHGLVWAEDGDSQTVTISDDD